jgi:hypothetical protein
MEAAKIRMSRVGITAHMLVVIQRQETLTPVR